MADRNTIRKLQKRAAACTDELLDISRDISNEVLPHYTDRDRGIFDLQCMLQMKRCEKVGRDLAEIRRELEQALSETDDRDAVSAECRTSAQITLQIIAQNIAISDEKRILLQELKISSGEAKNAAAAAEKLKDAAELADLKNMLRKESER